MCAKNKCKIVDLAFKHLYFQKIYTYLYMHGLSQEENRGN